MKIALKNDAREIDRRASEEFFVDEIMLMENAGAAVAGETDALLNTAKGKTIAVLAGTGNNAGDAFAAARHLLNFGAKCKIFLAGDREKLTPSAAKNLSIAEAMGIETVDLSEEKMFDRFKIFLRRFANAVIDGLLGTGFHGEIAEDLKNIIETVNESKIPVIAVDIPSGVEADTGNAKVAIKANVTVSLGLPKYAHFFAPGADFAGRIVNASIGIPANLLTDDNIFSTIIDDELAGRILKPRSRGVYKGSVGRVLTLAGSNGMTGAAMLSSKAVLRVGGGLSELAIGKSLQNQIEPLTLEVMTKPIPEEDGAIGGEAALKAMFDLSHKLDALLIGPGLGRNPKTMELVRKVAAIVNVPIVLDADGINAFKNHADELSNTKKIAILTPHLGEFAAFLNLTVNDLKANLIEIVRDVAKKYRAIFVVKSECTLVAYPNGKIYAEISGNTGMATAGAGDVLAGTIAGLIKETGDKAPIPGVHLHATAGNLAYEEHGEGLMASDILENLGKARKKIEEIL